MSVTNELWYCQRERDWRVAMERYWEFVLPSHLRIEKEFDSLDANKIAQLSSREWYEFLLTKYYYWKYTAKNRYVTTTSHLKKYLDKDDSLDNLYSIKSRLFSFNKDDVATGLKIACEIRGLGTAGASGLLAVLFPAYFATVDQFAVKALERVNSLKEKAAISKMNPESLCTKDGVVLIKIMKEKANELNTIFKTDYWTARKIDMVLWVSGR